MLGSRVCFNAFKSVTIPHTSLQHSYQGWKSSRSFALVARAQDSARPNRVIQRGGRTYQPERFTSRDGASASSRTSWSGRQGPRQRHGNEYFRRPRPSNDTRVQSDRRSRQTEGRHASFADTSRHLAAYEEAPESVQHFAGAVERKDWEGAIAYYASASTHMIGTKLVSSYLILLARAAIKNKNAGPVLYELAQAASVVRTDSVKAGVPPSDPVYKRLFAVYRELSLWHEGESLWGWMISQDEQILFLSTYAAAIEFFAGTRKPLSFIEDIFNDALASNQGSFLHYHFSPNALVQDADTREFQHFPSDSEILLEKLIEARSLKDDVTNSYLLLDTALRVFGQTTERTVDALLQNVQSLDQRYLILRLALRGGVCPRPSTMQTFLYNLTRASGKKDIQLDEYVAKKTQELAAALKLVICWYDACGQFDERLIASALLPVQDIVLRLAQLGDLASGQLLANSTEQLVDAIYPLLTPPASYLHNSLLGIGSYANHPDLVNRNLEKLLDRGGMPDMTTCRALVVGSGASGSLENLKDAWAEVESLAKAQTRSIGALEFDALIFAVGSLRDPAAVWFLQSTATKHNYAVADGVIAKLKKQCSSTDTQPSNSTSMPITEDAQHEVENACSVLATMQGILHSIVNDPEYKLDHVALGMSVASNLPSSSQSSIIATEQPDAHAPLPVYYQAYQTLCINPTTLSEHDSDSDPALPLTQLNNHPILKQRFLDWCTMTDLLIIHHRQLWQTAVAQKPVSISDESTGLVSHLDDDEDTLVVGSAVTGTNPTTASGFGSDIVVGAGGLVAGQTRWSEDEEEILAGLSESENVYKDLLKLACRVRGIDV